MNALYQNFNTLLHHTQTDFKRYLYPEIAWNSRMLGIVGPRGVGKTTLLLQYIKENLNTDSALYASADDLYFSENTLFDLADDFYKNAGKHLFIDEIHKYPDWARQVKNIYDAFPKLKIVFTGSSVLDILKGSSDLSRRAPIYTMQGLSFREYLKLFHGIDAEVYSLKQILNREVSIKNPAHPLPLFRDYLKRGYYPFGMETEFNILLGQITLQMLETDIPHYANLSPGTSRKLKQLLVIIAGSVPFKPNFSKIAEILSVSRNSLEDYFSYMEKAGLIGQLRSATKGIRGLGKVDKVYLDNTNLAFSLADDSPDLGNLRETFFYNQMRNKNDVFSSDTGDFTIGKYSFEIGGKNKKHTQLEAGAGSFWVKDDIEHAYRNVIPLWHFGMNY